jgi:hypothetical protein
MDVIALMFLLNIALWIFGIVPVYFQPFLDQMPTGHCAVDRAAGGFVHFAPNGDVIDSTCFYSNVSKIAVIFFFRAGKSFLMMSQTRSRLIPR